MTEPISDDLIKLHNNFIRTHRITDKRVDPRWQHNQTIYFWDLPLELRRKIYPYVFEADKVLNFCIEERKIDDMSRSNHLYRLPLVSKLMYDESIELYYEIHHYFLYSYPSDVFVTPLSSKIRYLEIEDEDAPCIKTWPKLEAMKEVVIRSPSLTTLIEVLLGMSSLSGSIDVIKQIYMKLYGSSHKETQKAMRPLVEAVPKGANVIVSYTRQIIFWTNPRHWGEFHAQERWNTSFRMHLTKLEFETTGRFVCGSRCRKSEMSTGQIAMLYYKLRNFQSDSEETQVLDDNFGVGGDDDDDNEDED